LTTGRTNPFSRRAALAAVALAVALVFVGCERSLAPAVRVSTTDVSALKKALGSGDEANPAGEASASAEPTGFATLRGRFILTGAAPERAPLDVNKEQNICAPGGMKVLSESLVVDPATGGIKDVFIYLNQKIPADDAKWVHESFANAATEPVVFDQKQCVFLSHAVGIRTSQPLKILNSDPIGHNTNIVGSGSAQPFNQTVSAAGQIVYQPNGESPSPFDVTCSIHPWMSAKMIVRNSPYFAVTKADGSFEIPYVPAGVPLEFRVWQEKSGFVQKVSVDGKATTWSKGKLPVTLQPDQALELNVAVDAAAFSK
jgi:hypothetical protein